MLNKGAWPNARSCDRLHYCMLPSSEKRTITLRCQNSKLVCELSGICDVQGQSSECAYIRNAPNSEYLDQQKSMLNSKYALINNVHLITRKYSILFLYNHVACHRSYNTYVMGRSGGGGGGRVLGLQSP